jgi:hypothetical protein
VQRSTIGVGPALRDARRARGVSIAEASRDTRIRPELIRALETEEFDRLLGDVYVRGALRSYSTYLGLPSDRLLSVYASHAGDVAPAPAAPVGSPPVEPVVGAPRRRDNHRLLALAATTLVVLAVAFGVLSSRASAPPPSTLASNPVPEATGPGISLSLTAAEKPVGVTMWIDRAEPQTFTLLPGESRAFVANSTMTIRLARGGLADVVVAGRDLGLPGRPAHPWKRTFSYTTPGADRPPASTS